MLSKRLSLINDAKANEVVTRNAVNLFGPGHSTGTGISTSSGATVSTTATLVNNSGAAISTGSLTFAGWILTSSGTSNVGNDVPVTANIEYPVGVTLNTMTSSGSATITIPNGSDILTDQVTLTTVIPTGATFKVNISATQANGAKYIGTVSGTTGHSFGLCGVNTTTLRSVLKKEMFYAIGDSIMTNNSGCIAVCAGFVGCPSLQMSISGTQATTYGASSAANFTKQVSIAAKIGATRFVSDFGTNDIGSSLHTAAQLVADLQAMKTRALASGILFAQTTLLPRTTKSTITVTTATAFSNTISLLVPDASKFVVGGVYTIAGANEAEYNGNKFCLSVDTGTNIITVPCITGTAALGTGTITITSRGWSTRELQTPVTGFAAGGASDRGLFNANVRAGSFDSYIDWGDACELVRDDGIWAVYGDKTEIDATLSTTTKTGFTTSSRFQINGTWQNGSLASGQVQFLSGANIGEIRTGNGNTGGDFTATVAYSNAPTVGDQIYVATGNYASDDGLHPRVATGTIGTSSRRGAQALIENKTITWMQRLL